MPDSWVCPETGKTFKTGSKPTSRSKLLAAIPFMPMAAAPSQIAYVPKYRSNFGNDRYGDCVTAEEGFAKSCALPGVQPEIQIPEQTVIDLARRNGDLNGADLGDVLDKLARKGFVVGGQEYRDGPKQGVDYENESVLQAAIAVGPVKIAIAAGALPGGAGSRDGWFSLSARSRNTDHCTALCGFGTAEWLYQQLGVPLPSGLAASTPGYLQYTWSTIGFVNHDWIMGTVEEAWIRTPCTIGIPPLTPPTPPTPPLPPGPGPSPVMIPITIPAPLPAGDYVLVQRLKV
jgi:hypothetical protein